MIRALVEQKHCLSPYVQSTIVNDEEFKPAAGATPEAFGTSAPGAGLSAVPVERWLSEYGDILWRFVLGRVRSREIAEEVVQETVLAAMQSYAAFAGKSSEQTWLLGIATHKVADHFRRERRHTGDAGAIKPANSGSGTADIAGMFTVKGLWARPPKAWGLDPGDTTENAEILATLRRCIEALPPSHGEAVWLRDLLNIPSSEVCKVMGISATNLWSRMHRARVALRMCVEKSMGLSGEDAR